MEKTISINLGGALFYAEEDAYRRLDSYLQEIDRYFSAQGDDSAEILRDIESSLAEQFNNAGAGELRRALTLPEVETALKSMGTIQDFSEEDKSLPSATVAGEQGKRFYRDRDDAIIGGVCSGLGHYFGFDPVWVRLLFFLSLFLWGFGIWIYLILWIAAPEAKTAAQKLTMQGEAVNLSSLSAKLKDNLQGEKLKQAGSGAIVALENFLRRFFSLLGRLFNGLGGAVFFIFGLFLSLISLAAFCAFALFGAVASFSGPQYLEPGLVAAIGWSYPWLVISVVLSLALPCLALLSGALMILFRRKFLPSLFWILLLIFWFFSFLSAGALTSSAYARVRPYLTEQKTEIIPLNSEINSLSITGPYYLRVIPGEKLSLQAQGRSADLENMVVSLENGKLAIKAEPSHDWICFNCGHSVELVLTAPSSLIDVTVGDRAVLNLEDWRTDKISLDFQGVSGGNLKLYADAVNLKASNNADVDFLEGAIKSLSIEADLFANVDSSPLVAEEARVSLDGAARVSVRVQKRLQVVISPDAPDARLFYNTDLKKLEVDPALSSQLFFLGQEDDSFLLETEENNFDSETASSVPALSASSTREAPKQKLR